MAPSTNKPQEEDDPLDLAEELPSQAGVRVFRVPAGQLVALTQKHILKGLMHLVQQNPHPVHDELLPLLELCKHLGPEAFELVLLPRQACAPRLRAMRARALALCKRWYIAWFHNRLNNQPVKLIFPHDEDWRE